MLEKFSFLVLFLIILILVDFHKEKTFFFENSILKLLLYLHLVLN